MVRAWIRRHPAAAAAGEDDEYWVNRAFERFFIAVGPERFGTFPSLAALLTMFSVLLTVSFHIVCH